MKVAKLEQIRKVFAVLVESAKTVLVPVDIIQDIIRRNFPGAPPDLLENRDLLEVIRIVLAGLTDRCVGATEKTEAGLGLILRFVMLFEPLKKGSSVKRAHDAIKRQPGETDSVYQLLRDYAQLLHQPMTWEKHQIETWLQQISNVGGRTVYRYLEAGDIAIANALGETLPAILEDLLATSMPDSKAVLSAAVPLAEAESSSVADSDTAEISKTSVIAMVMKYSRNHCCRVDAAFGIEPPLEQVVSRKFKHKDEPFLLDSQDIGSHLIGCTGVIVGHRGSGRTTALKTAVVHGAADEQSRCLLAYFSAKDYVSLATKKCDARQFLAHQLVNESYVDKRLWDPLLHQLIALSNTGKLTFIVDDLECLDYASQRLVLSQLAGSVSIFFICTPGTTNSITELMRRYGYTGNLLVLELVDLDDASRDQIAVLGAKLIGVDYCAGEVARYFNDRDASFGRTALEVLAYVRSIKTSPDVQFFSYSWALLCEFVRRAGYPTPRLAKSADDLETPLRDLILLGKVLHDTLVRGLSYYDDRRPFTAWLSINAIESDYGIAVDKLLCLGIFIVVPSWSGIRFSLLCLQELISALYTYYYGPLRYSFFDMLFLGKNSEILHTIQHLAQSVPALFEDGER